MNWLQRLFGSDRPDTTVRDPDSVVLVAALPLWQTPLIVTGLEQRGITATFADVSSHRRANATAEIYVRERDRAAAEAIIALLTARSRPPTRGSHFRRRTTS